MVVMVVAWGFLLRVTPVRAGRTVRGVSEGVLEFRGGMMIAVPRLRGRPSPGSSRST